jgi:3-hydroxyisobutyrate dehydrogenase-like beta-hydroxyacid dehydrogenase
MVKPKALRRVGMVGLGDQGQPMARLYLQGGWPFAFYARRPEVISEFKERGATFTPTMRELGAASDIVLVIVNDGPDVREVVIEQKMYEDMEPGSVIVIHSTIEPDTCAEVAAAAEPYGVLVVDAPVSGGPQRTHDGELTMPVGCDDPDVFDAIKPVLDVTGKYVQRMGKLGTGQITKLLNNLYYAAHLVTARDEALLIQKLGIDVAAAAKILPTCSGMSDVFRQSAIAPDPFRPVGHLYQGVWRPRATGGQVDLIREVFKSRGVDIETMFPATHALVEESMRRGFTYGTVADPPGDSSE